MGQNTAPCVRVTLDISPEYADGLIALARRKTLNLDEKITDLRTALTVLVSTSDLLLILEEYGVVTQLNVELLEPKSTTIKVAGLVREVLVSDYPTSIEELAAVNAERFLTPEIGEGWYAREDC